MRFIGYFILLALIGYGLWPYYSVYRLDDAITANDTAELAQMVDLPAIRANYKKRVAAGVQGVLPTDDPDSVVSWIRQNLERLGDSALEQAITIDWVRETLRGAVTEATGQSPPYLLAGIDFAFFESYNRFLIRIGKLGEGATHVRFSLVGSDWKITDIIP
ncbi:DUF2939 domain-containing protein [Thiocystis violacea]|uniref:DUF2939 domain-containing protein n=1 Tax=Thiocystis violacea TaxID=13725 RepID=UPI001904DEFB|nr:DUF2939 domain-containing protein [Thiocystis violacea]MBK1724130.1 hypothetical protein [Thiocystis violacea]